jgi:hypothetical protein
LAETVVFQPVDGSVEGGRRVEVDISALPGATLDNPVPTGASVQDVESGIGNSVVSSTVVSVCSAGVAVSGNAVVPEIRSVHDVEPSLGSVTIGVHDLVSPMVSTSGRVVAGVMALNGTDEKLPWPPTPPEPPGLPIPVEGAGMDIVIRGILKCGLP